MGIIENTYAISTKILKKDLQKARDKKKAEGFLDIFINGRKFAIYYSIDNVEEESYLVLSAGPKKQRILLSEQKLTFGTRSYLTCNCGKRTNALYLNKERFACRKCQNLKYQSTTINRTTKQGKLIYITSQTIKAMNLKEGIDRFFYNSKYTKKMKRYIALCEKNGFNQHVQDAQELMSSVNNISQ